MTHCFLFVRRQITTKHNNIASGRETTAATMQCLCAFWGQRPLVVLWGLETLGILSPTAPGGAIQDISPSCVPLVSLQHLWYDQEVPRFPTVLVPGGTFPPFGPGCPTEQNSEGQKESTGQGEHSCLTGRSFEGHGQKTSLQQGVPRSQAFSRGT